MCIDNIPGLLLIPFNIFNPHSSVLFKNTRGVGQGRKVNFCHQSVQIVLTFALRGELWGLWWYIVPEIYFPRCGFSVWSGCLAMGGNWPVFGLQGLYWDFCNSA